LTPVSIAMADEYRLPPKKHSWEFVIDSYRHYYLEGKWKFASWKNNRMPQWWPKDHYKNKYNEEILNYNKTFNANLAVIT